MKPKQINLVDALYSKMSLDQLLQMRSNLVDQLAVLDQYINTKYPAASVPELPDQEVPGNE